MNICFTGHRPNKLGGYDWKSLKNQKIMNELSSVIENVLNENINDEVKFICGGALGIDQMAFHVCNELKNKYNNIILEVAVPFKNQYIRWFRQSDLDRYFGQLKNSDIVTYVDEIDKYKRTKTNMGEYNPYKLQVRNEYMVDNSDLVIAVWNGTNGGTANCINYAYKIGKKVIKINPDEIK